MSATMGAVPAGSGQPPYEWAAAVVLLLVVPVSASRWPQGVQACSLDRVPEKLTRLTP